MFIDASVLPAITKVVLIQELGSCDSWFVPVQANFETPKTIPYSKKPIILFDLKRIIFINVLTIYNRPFDSVSDVAKVVASWPICRNSSAVGVVHVFSSSTKSALRKAANGPSNGTSKLGTPFLSEVVG